MLRSFFKKRYSSTKNELLSSKIIDDPDALWIIKTLKDNGYKAYIVGGAVRDALLGKKPKDFDIVTSAKPKEILKYFKRSRLIGKRFQVVHLYFKNKTIEVSTFRREKYTFPFFKQHRINDPIVSDNHFGKSVFHDAQRRDTTINALYYDPTTKEMIDVFGGIQDLKAGKIVIIGKPEERFQEDPGRILRVLRMATLVDTKLDQKTEQTVVDSLNLLKKMNTSRGYEEIKKMIITEKCLENFELLRDLGAWNVICPSLGVLLAKQKKESEVESFFKLVFDSTAERIKNKQIIASSFIFSTLFWHIFYEQFQKSSFDYRQFNQSVNWVFDYQNKKGSIQIPRFTQKRIKSIWWLQFGFDSIMKNELCDATRQLFLRSEGIRAAYHLYTMRQLTANADQATLDYWKPFF